jgi:hypothetical protein
MIGAAPHGGVVPGRSGTADPRASGRPGPWLGRLRGRRRERELPPAHVVPRAVLVADLAEGPDRPEPHCLVEADAGVVGQGDTRERRDVAEPAQLVEQADVQCAPGAPPALRLGQVDRRLDRPPVGGPRAVRRGVGVTDHDALADGGEPRPSRRRQHPPRDLVDGRGRLLERRDRAGDHAGVDRLDGRGVVRGRGAHVREVVHRRRIGGPGPSHRSGGRARPVRR